MRVALTHLTAARSPAPNTPAAVHVAGLVPQCVAGDTGAPPSIAICGAGPIAAESNTTFTRAICGCGPATVFGRNGTVIVNVCCAAATTGVPATASRTMRLKRATDMTPPAVHTLRTDGGKPVCGIRRIPYRLADRIGTVGDDDDDRLLNRGQAGCREIRQVRHPEDDLERVRADHGGVHRARGPDPDQVA